jgi:hypothetical protein
MADENISGDIAEIRKELEVIKSLLEEIHGAVLTDHEKIEKLEATTADDQKKLKELEETKKNLEMTGRINVRPLGL